MSQFSLRRPLICIIIVSNPRSKTVKLRRCSVSGCIETTLRLHSLLKIWALEMHDFSLFLMMCLRDWEFSFILHISERTVLWIILNMLLVLFWILTPHQIIFLLWIWCSEFSQSQQWAFTSVSARGNAPWNWVFFKESAMRMGFFLIFF